MTETAADEQDLAKALDSVADASADLGGTSSVGSSSGVDLPPIVPPGSPIVPSVPTPAFPPITPVASVNDPTPNDAPAPFTPQPHVAEPPALPDLNGVGVPDPASDPAPVATPDPAPVADEPAKTIDTSAPSGPLGDIKKDALNELRPLVDKLSVSAEEKFDTYLLLIRSTDDTNLIGPAHEAAKAIEDEARRAEALLDIIKEIDYLSRQQKPEQN
jgi:hypothetical protein